MVVTGNCARSLMPALDASAGRLLEQYSMTVPEENVDLTRGRENLLFDSCATNKQTNGFNSRVENLSATSVGKPD